MNFRPLQDRILVERIEAETKTAGGIILPDASQEKPMQGTVISVGSGYISEDGKVRPLDVVAGDTIMFAQWAGTELKIDGKEFLIMKEADVIGIIG